MTIPTHRIHVAISFPCECGHPVTCGDVPAVRLCRCGRQYTIRGQAQIKISIIDLTPFPVAADLGTRGAHAEEDRDDALHLR